MAAKPLPPHQLKLNKEEVDSSDGGKGGLAGTTAEDAAGWSGAPMETDKRGLGPRTGNPMRRGEDAAEENQSLQRAPEEDAADIEQDLPEIADEPIERDSGEEGPDPPIFEE